MSIWICEDMNLHGNMLTFVEQNIKNGNEDLKTIDNPIYIGEDNNTFYSIRIEGIIDNNETYTIDNFAVDVENDKYIICRRMVIDISSYSLRHIMRVISRKTGEILWSDSSFVNNHFMWSAGSKYLAVQY